MWWCRRFCRVLSTYLRVVFLLVPASTTPPPESTTKKSLPPRNLDPVAALEKSRASHQQPSNSACATIQEVYRNWVRATGPIFMARMPRSHAHCPSSRRACDRRWWQSSTITRCRTGLGLVLPTNHTNRLCSIFVRHLPPKRRVATASGRSRSGLIACASMASGAMATRLSVPFCSSMCACLGAASAAPGTSLSSSSSSSSSSNSSNSSSSSRRAMPPMLPRPRGCRPRCRLASDAAPDPASPLMPPRPQCRPRCPLAPSRRSPQCRLAPDAAPVAAPDASPRVCVCACVRACVRVCTCVCVCHQIKKTKTVLKQVNGGIIKKTPTGMVPRPLEGA